MTPEQEQQLFTTVDAIKVDVDKLTTNVDKLTTNVDKLTTDVEKFNDRFSNYQQATQWVVQLAFSLIASATVVIIVSNVLNK
jgi:tetrahydromethanopterin S-methyltransferase subunit B